MCPSGLNATLRHGVGVAGQGLAQRARVGRVGEIPQPHGVIGAGGGQGVPVGAKRHTVHGVGVAGQGLARGVGWAGSVSPTTGWCD